MKKLFILMLFIFFVSCQNSEKINLSSTRIEDASLKSYDFINNKTTVMHSIDESNVKELVKIIESLKLSPMDSFQGFTNDSLYSIEFDPNDQGAFLLSENIIITSEGEIFSYKEKELIKTIDSYLKGSTSDYDLLEITNQRYISIIDGLWDPKYLTETNLKKETALEVFMDVEIDFDTQSLHIMISNEDDVAIETGWEYHLEVKIDGRWYQINNIGKNNFRMDFLGEGIIIQSDESEELIYNWEHILPLPVGDYRILLEIDTDDGSSVVAKGFTIFK